MSDVSQYLDKESSLRFASTITEVIYRSIKDSILKRKLKPGQRIKIREISGYLGVSQTPVREAIQRLASERFLTVEKRSEIKVVEIGAGESREISELIEILDKASMKKVIENTTNQDLDDLARMMDRLEEHYRGRKIDLYLTQNQQVHNRIWRMIGNSAIIRTLIEALERLQIVESQYHSYFDDEAFLAKSWLSHVDLMKALVEKNEEAAVKVASEHWRY